MSKKSALGKGLGALIKQSETENVENPVNATDKIDIQKIEVNPFQPRTNFDQEALEELAVSIRQLGIIQPITVREIDGGKYQIISGERRYRASQMAGLKEIPAFIRHADDGDMLELALVENIQREDLDAIEVAISYQRLIDECQLTQENVSERVGKKRSTIANYLRLLKLPAEVQLAIRQRTISMGHARALINIEQEEQQIQILKEVLENGLSVRQVEQAVRQINQPEVPSVTEDPGTSAESGQEPEPEPSGNIQEIPSGNDPETPDSDSTEPEKTGEGEILIYEDPHPPIDIPEDDEHIHLKERLSKYFGTKVDLKRDAEGAGRIVIPFRTDDELQYILQVAERMHEKNT